MGHCHCRMCQKAHGSPFSTYVQYDKSAFVFEGDTNLMGRYRSSDEATRSFCRRCGAKFAFEHRAFADSIWLAAGLLVGDLGIAPSYHIFFASRAAWYPIDDDLPKYDAYPPVPA
ncbi:MAG: GFA family protein [Pseudomonadota bacterium]